MGNVSRRKQEEVIIILRILKELRLQADLTQEELAKKAGISRVNIAMLESGKQPTAKSDTIIKLAKALNVAPGVLLRPDSCPK